MALLAALLLPFAAVGLLLALAAAVVLAPAVAIRRARARRGGA